MTHSLNKTEVKNMSFVDNYIAKRVASLQLYLKYCNHSKKKHKLLTELKIWEDFNKRTNLENK